jgi:hypothetical protein
MFLFHMPPKAIFAERHIATMPPAGDDRIARANHPMKYTQVRTEIAVMNPVIAR